MDGVLVEAVLCCVAVRARLRGAASGCMHTVCASVKVGMHANIHTDFHTTRHACIPAQYMDPSTGCLQRCMHTYMA